MGQYCYLINKEKRIRVEAYKLSGSDADYIPVIEDDENLIGFIEYCRDNKLNMECVNEHYFIDVDEDFENPFTDFEYLKSKK